MLNTKIYSLKDQKVCLLSRGQGNLVNKMQLQLFAADFGIVKLRLLHEMCKSGLYCH